MIEKQFSNLHAMTSNLKGILRKVLQKQHKKTEVTANKKIQTDQIYEHRSKEDSYQLAELKAKIN